MQNEWNKKQATVQIPLGRLHRFPEHPYKVEDNEEMEALTESIQEYGILKPLLVRRMESSETDYELISGHRRAYAAAKAGLETVPVFVVSLDRNEAVIALVDSNLHRERLLPSEKAFAYKLKMEALAHQGTSRQVGEKWSVTQISEGASESERQIHRCYIRLTKLLPQLLNLMDEGKIAFSVGVELSYLPDEAQAVLLDAMERNDCTPSYAQAMRLHRAYNNGTLDRWLIDTTLAEPKPNQQEHIHLKRENIARFFPEHYTAAQIEQDIQAGKLLRRQRDRSQDAR